MKPSAQRRVSAGANNFPGLRGTLPCPFICSIFLFLGGRYGQQLWTTIRFPDGRQFCFPVVTVVLLLARYRAQNYVLICYDKSRQQQSRSLWGINACMRVDKRVWSPGIFWISEHLACLDGLTFDSNLPTRRLWCPFLASNASFSGKHRGHQIYRKSML